MGTAASSSASSECATVSQHDILEQLDAWQLRCGHVCSAANFARLVDDRITTRPENRLSKYHAHSAAWQSASRVHIGVYLTHLASVQHHVASLDR